MAVNLTTGIIRATKIIKQREIMTTKTTHHTSKHQPGSLHIGQTTPLKTAVWHTRRTLRRVLKGTDVLNVDKHGAVRRQKARHVYRKVDDFVAAFFPVFVKTIPKDRALKHVKEMIEQLEYTVVEADETKPWGGFYRLADEESERFIAEFFPGLTLQEARLGQADAVLSPKFLLVEPGQRLSWQYHHRRAERWHFLTNGSYYKAKHDTLEHRIIAPAGTIVQFAQGERHRLCTHDTESYTLVAEIWQHTDPTNPSDEADIVRLQDDYKR